MFSKLKKMAGMINFKIEIEMPTELPNQNGEASGALRLHANSDLTIKGVSLKLMEEYSTGRGDERTTQSLELGSGQFDLPLPFDIAAGETKVLPFALSYVVRRSNNDELKQMGGVFGAIGKASAWVDQEGSEFYVIAEVDVKDVVLDPSQKLTVRLI